MPTLNATTELNTLRTMYLDTSANETLNIIIYGDKGTGKTTFCTTGRKPVLIHSFDPGGTKHFRPEIEVGELFVDTQFEKEDVRRPSSYDAWVREYERLEAGGVFDNIGTFCIDSLTTFGDNLMNYILAKDPNTKAMDNPGIQHYLKQISYAKELMKRLTMLPCDIVITAHVERILGAEGALLGEDIMFTGKGKVKIPILFDEVYRSMIISPVGKDDQFVIDTVGTSLYRASTRWGRGGAFERFEQPSLKELRRKAGLSVDDVT